ncbi:hypothetical protein [Micromonospora profundi]|uniref:hypothetical protein n=1 Tax=Micromonospora profundi TaxID=1420889 RepID=UPI003657E80F
MTDVYPFDLSLPSPVGRLLQLRAGASEAVVREGELSDVQTLMARPGALEDELWEALGAEPRLRMLVLTGSAGSGKSAALNHLLKREHTTGAGRIGACLADATHSDAPDRGQAERLAEFFAPFTDSSPEPSEACRVIAMNTGMALRFFADLPGIADAPPLTQLEALLRARLGLKELPVAAPPPDWMTRAVLVVNFDHRTTSGTEGSLFESILQRLDPHDQSGVFEGARRCSTCTVSDWCWPMANATAMSSEPGRRALDVAAGDVALARGRQIAPRALWDAAAELALGGLNTNNLNGRDACYAIADAAAAGDEAALVHGMACNGALGPVLLQGASLNPSAQGTLVAELSHRDPSYDATLPAHQLIADSGLDPEVDAEQLLRALHPSNSQPHRAVQRAARALEEGKASSPEGDRLWGRVLSRAAWLAGSLRSRSEVSPEFANALVAQSSGATEDDGSPSGQTLYNALNIIEEGLAAIFGLVSGPEHYYPTSTPGADAQADLMVRVHLIEDGWLKSRPDPVIAANPLGAKHVAYRPLSLSLVVAGKPIAVDYPLWKLLQGAASGATPSTVDLERFLALRQAIRLVGVRAGEQRDRPLLVRQRGAGGRRFRIVVRNSAAGLLRATEVL